MKQRNLLVGAAVALVCGGILVLFTDIEVKLVEWVNCGPLSAGREEQSEICRRAGSR
ncbi:MAG: hypothetical protein ACKOXO_11910 [Cyanobium sp.]